MDHPDAQVLLRASGIGQQLLKFEPASAKLFEGWRVDRRVILLGDHQNARVGRVLACLHGGDTACDAVADHDQVRAVGRRASSAIRSGASPLALWPGVLHRGNLECSLRVEGLQILM